jgi:hypothetical protein
MSRDGDRLDLMASTPLRRIAARSLAILARHQLDLAEEVLAEEPPWLHWLPKNERAACARELLGDLVAGADTGLLLPFARNLASWRATAEVWPDPLSWPENCTAPSPATGPSWTVRGRTWSDRPRRGPSAAESVERACRRPASPTTAPLRRPSVEV